MSAHITTDHVIDAVRATRDVYVGIVEKLSARSHTCSVIAEAKRVALFDQLLNDEHACEMFAGRLYQISHGTPAPKEEDKSS